MSRLVVRLTPRGGRDAIEGWTSDAAGRPVLLVRVAAAAVQDAANQALIALLAKTLGRPRSAVRLVAGARGRMKQIQIEGLLESEQAERLAPPPSKAAR